MHHRRGVQAKLHKLAPYSYLRRLSSNDRTTLVCCCSLSSGSTALFTAGPACHIGNGAMEIAVSLTPDRTADQLLA